MARLLEGRHPLSRLKGAMAAYWHALSGGMLIGAAVPPLLANGRVAGMAALPAVFWQAGVVLAMVHLLSGCCLARLSLPP